MDVGRVNEVPRWAVLRCPPMVRSPWTAITAVDVGLAVDGADDGHDGGVGNALFGSLLGEGFDEVGVADH
jgi:hypothetical protein